MNEYVITTDDNADLPESYLKEHGIGCGYFSYHMDGTHYTHESFLPVKEFYAKMRNGSLPTTAAVNSEDMKDVFRPVLEEGKDILHIAFSSGLSTGYNSARLAAEEMLEEYPERKIVVVDSLAASMGEGLLVYYAQKLKEEGKDYDTVVKWTQDHIQNMVHIFTVDDLDHLHRGGRVSKTTAIVGSMLNIKPILVVDEEGHLINIGKIRGRKKSLQELVRLMDEKIGSYKESCDTVFISHGDCEKDAEYVMKLVKEKYPVKVEMINYVGATIGAHSGPGTLALFFMGDNRK